MLREDDPVVSPPWASPVALTGLVIALILLLSYAGRVLGTAPAPIGTPVPVSVSFPVAFLAGGLALLSPCSGAIVPAFFAYSFRTPGRLLRQTYVFFLGLALVFVPLGFASSLLSALFVEHASVFYYAGGGLLLVLGLTTLAGVDLFALLPGGGARRIAQWGQGTMSNATDDTTRVLVYGVVFGFATSSCTAPIIGAMATLAAGSGFASLQAMLLFLTFALGVVTPLFVLAAVFDRYRVAERGWLRPRSMRLFGREVLVHHLVTGLVLVALGLVFIAFRGTLDLTATYNAWGATEFYARATLRLEELFGGLPPWVTVVGTAAALAGGAFALTRFAARGRTPD